MLAPMDETPDPSRITNADIAELNDRQLVRSSLQVRLASNALFGLAALLAAGWFWTLWRLESRLAGTMDVGLVGLGSPFADEVGASPSLALRIDALANTLGMLAYAGIVAGLAIALRFYADAANARHGGSLTGWNVGDTIEERGDVDEP